MVLLSAVALSLLWGLVFSVPVPDDDISTIPLLVAPILPAVLPDTQDSSALDTAAPLLLGPALPSPSTTPEDPDPLYLYPSQSTASVSLVLTTTTEVVTDTQIITEPTTVTVSVPVSAAPSTVTDVTTVFVPTSARPASASSSSTATAPPGAKAQWVAPPQMTDLAAFNISAFPDGQQNLRLVTGIPASASASATPPSGLLPLPFLAPSSSPSADYLPWDNASTALQLLYPAHSANPAAHPIGGAEFYAAPLAIAQAQVVTLCYSVFFPTDFDWVKAGKLPGLYGGRPACSGGDAALDCFSTRLMWRQNGEGELYLYAAKDKQTRALCADPRSTCDAAYGFSIGRGAFEWCLGRWTTVCQVVQLNTPGMQDGIFELYVDGDLKIRRDDIYYRGVPPGSSSASKTKSTSASPSPSSASDSDGGDDDGDDGGLIPGLLNTLLDRRRTTRVQEIRRDTRPLLLSVPTPAPPPPPTQEKDEETENDATGVVALPDAHEWAFQLAPATDAPTPTDTSGTTTVTATTTVFVYPTLIPGSEQAGAALHTALVGFIGIFFSTFFGGHGASYQTPRDQFVYFKDFGLVFNQ
ncbi:hypothetical protein C8R47DRAFT_175004 [Mycena vitilis]|nr:hypothetical protein C8R47DRAFT_175004 [Mycena vitilis]